MKAKPDLHRIKSIQDLIKFYAAIPAKQWTMYLYQDSGGKCCALGHLGVRRSVSKDLKTTLSAIGVHYRSLMDYNDADYLGATPRTRVLKYLRSLLPKRKAKVAGGKK